MVEPAFVETVLGPPDYVVPLQDVGGQRFCYDVGNRILIVDEIIKVL